MAASLKVLKTVDYETDKFMAASAVYVEAAPVFDPLRYILAAPVS